jgi:hypothetical protein
MRRSIAGSIIALSLAVTGTAYAQETTPGPAKAEVTVIPAGGTFFRAKGPEPKFKNYDLGGSFGYNFTRIVGVEGEIGEALGVRQNIQDLSGSIINEKTPNMLSYTGNVIVHLPGGSVVPYATGGIGGLTLYQREILAVLSSDTFLTGNVGGGVKWYAPNGRWGLRGDYRFQAVRSKTDAPAFFGQENRYSNRVYGGVVINVAK